MMVRLALLLFAVLLIGAALLFLSSAISSSNGSLRREAKNGFPASGSPRMHAAARTSENLQGSWFAEVRDLGIDFLHVSGTSGAKPFPAANGSGVAALDYDLDGKFDLYFATGTKFPIDLNSSEPINRLYRSCGGWSFRDVTVQAGLGHNGFSAGLAVGDYDSDGFSDVYVACFGANCLYRNQGDGTYTEVARQSGVDDRRWGTSAAFLDYDRDGLLDLYACNYGKWSWETNQFCGDQSRNVRLYCSPRSVEPELSILYRNVGDGTFEETTVEAGLGARAARSQGVVAADVNNDGWIDLYVGNDLHPNFLFLNKGNGTFEDLSELSGTAYDSVGSVQAGMGVDAADIDRDGDMELFVTNFGEEHNALYQNDGAGIFHEISHTAGLAEGSLPWVGWGTAFADFDLDGWSDAIITNGHVDDNRHLLGQDAPYAQPPLLYRNTGSRFEPVVDAGGYFKQSHVGRGLAIADFDNDADYDAAISHQDTAPALLRNDVGQSHADRGAIVLHLTGTVSNRDAIGSAIVLTTDSGRIVQQVKGGGSYLSANDARQIIAATAGAAIQWEIRWPNGKQSIIKGLQPGQHYRIIEPVDPQSPPIVFAKRDNHD